jgi:hypothetical protein
MYDEQNYRRNTTDQASPETTQYLHLGSKRSEEVYKSRSFLEKRYEVYSPPVLLLNAPREEKPRKLQLR